MMTYFAMRSALAPMMLPVLAALLSACAGGSMGEGPRAVATLSPTQGNSATGTATFVQHGDTVLVMADISGLEPNSEHGFHVHARGDCSGNGEGAGGHFNPFNRPHGGPNSAERHAGDMPNLRADASGHAVYRTESTLMTVTSGPGSIVGKGLIIHLNPDDYTTQPTGNSGARIACSVIQHAS